MSVICLFLFFYTIPNAVRSQVTISTASDFTTLDNSDLSPDGIFTVSGGDLTITSTGSINGPSAGNGHLQIRVLNGNLVMQVGARISGDVNATNKVGSTITIWATDMLLAGNGNNGAKISSNQPTGSSCNGGKGGNINLNASGDIVVAFGAVISANASCSAGDIVLLAPQGEIFIDGLVQSRSTLSGIPNQPPSGGPITVGADCKLTVGDNGKVSSEGGDGGADLVHLDACQVVVWGLVQSTGFGHSVPVNPITSLVPPNRPDKPSNSTAGVEVWGNTIVVNKNAPHKGEINANLPAGAGSRAWIDILAGSHISILGAPTGNYAVHSNIGGNNGQGGIITIKSLAGSVTANGLAVQSNGIGSGNRRGGPVTIESSNSLNLFGAKMQATGANLGGTFALRSFNGTINEDAGTNLNVSNGGSVTRTACPVTCGGSPSLSSQPYVTLPDANCLISSCFQEQPCVCINCDGEVVVNENVNVNFNTNPPTYSGDPDLLSYFSYDKSGGATADKWKAIFNLGPKKLTVTNNATVTVSKVSGYAPGLEFITTCEVGVDKGASIKVISDNRNAGDLVIDASGPITINGELRNQVTGTLGLPGAITATSRCGNMDVAGLVQILGVDGGGNTITLLTCVADCAPLPFQGDITISGLVKSFAAAHAGDLTLNRPDIRVVSMNGRVVVNANSAEPLYDEFSTGGGAYDIYGGLLSWVTANVNPGSIEVQAQKDVIVHGHGTDPTGPVRKSFGAIAAIGTASAAPGGLLDIRSLDGKIVGNDRAFDVGGRNRLSTNFAHIILNAKQDIDLNRPGASNNFNPVVNASGFGSGDFGGVNDLRSYSGSIVIGTDALVTADVVSGTDGSNNLTSCLGVTNNGTINPASAFLTDCSVAAPEARYTNCPDIDGDQARGVSIRTGSAKTMEVSPGLYSFPNPVRNVTTLSYTLTKRSYVLLKVYTMAGKEVGTLVDNEQLPGRYNYTWKTANLPSGVYYARIQTGEFSATNKLVLTK